MTSFSARAYIIVHGIYLRSNKKRQHHDGVLCLALSQGSDSGETPLFVGFSDLGIVVGLLWSPYEGYTRMVFGNRLLRR